MQLQGPLVGDERAAAAGGRHSAADGSPLRAAAVWNRSDDDSAASLHKSNRQLAAAALLVLLQRHRELRARFKLKLLPERANVFANVAATAGVPHRSKPADIRNKCEFRFNTDRFAHQHTCVNRVLHEFADVHVLTRRRLSIMPVSFDSVQRVMFFCFNDEWKPVCWIVLLFVQLYYVSPEREMLQKV